MQSTDVQSMYGVVQQVGHGVPGTNKKGGVKINDVWYNYGVKTEYPHKPQAGDRVELEYIVYGEHQIRYIQRFTRIEESGERSNGTGTGYTSNQSSPHPSAPPPASNNRLECLKIAAQWSSMKAGIDAPQDVTTIAELFLDWIEQREDPIDDDF